MARNWNPSEMNESLLMSENQRRTDGLQGKVSLLKSFAIDIEKETKDQNRYLDNMQTSFESAGGLLNGTLSRVLGVHKNSVNNRKLMCYIILGIVFAFIFFYYIVYGIVSMFKGK